MILRLFALLFAGAGLVIGLFGGWQWTFGDAVSRINPRLLVNLHDGITSILWNGAWDSLFGPVFFLPVWTIAGGVALILFTIAAFQPGKA